MISARDIKAHRSAIRTVKAEEEAGESLLVGDSPRFREALDLMQRSAAADINILLLGETGTGKEVFARAIHRMSSRRGRVFMPVDCAVLPDSLIEAEIFGHERGAYTGAVTTQPGRFELAQGGTLFLDEIGNIPPTVQAKLLRVLQERQLFRVGGRDPVALNVRVIAATNLDLSLAIRDGRFRPDLFYRLNEVTLRLPALRDRSEDIPLLAWHYAALYGRRFAKSPTALPPRLARETLEVLQGHRWPGNVRELENVMKAAALMAVGEAEIRPEHLPAELLAASSALVSTLSGDMEDDTVMQVSFTMDLKEGIADLKSIGVTATEHAERQVLRMLLARRRLNLLQLARLLQVDPKTLRSKLKKYQMSEEQREPTPEKREPIPGGDSLPGPSATVERGVTGTETLA